MGNAEREREQDPRCWTIQSQAERRDRGQTEESWLLFEGIDTSLYDLMRKSRKKMRTACFKILFATLQGSYHAAADAPMLNFLRCGAMKNARYTTRVVGRCAAAAGPRHCRNLGAACGVQRGGSALRHALSDEDVSEKKNTATVRLLAQCLGFAVTLGSFTLKLPQIQKCVSSASVEVSQMYS